MTRTTAAIFAVFATIWWIAGLYGAHVTFALHYAVGIAVGMAVFAVAASRKRLQVSPEDDARRGRVAGYASAAEGVAILIAVNVCNHVGRTDLLVPAIAVIVGLHFIPFALFIPDTAYYVPAALLVAAAVIGAVAVPAGDTRTLVVSIASAVILWGTAGAALVRRAKAT